MVMHAVPPSNSPTFSLSASEPRKKDRKWRRFPVELSSSVSSTGPEWSGTAVNLSRQECAIHGTTAVHTGDYLHVLIFPGANQTPIEVEVAQVQWAVNEHFGVEFLTFAPCEGNRLQDLLAINGAWHIAKEEPSWAL